jgi:hypothetical protein
MVAKIDGRLAIQIITRKIKQWSRKLMAAWLFVRVKMSNCHTKNQTMVAKID